MFDILFYFLQIMEMKKEKEAILRTSNEILNKRMLKKSEGRKPNIFKKYGSISGKVPKNIKT